MIHPKSDVSGGGPVKIISNDNMKDNSARLCSILENELVQESIESDRNGWNVAPLALFVDIIPKKVRGAFTVKPGFGEANLFSEKSLKHSPRSEGMLVPLIVFQIGFTITSILVAWSTRS